MFCDVRYALAAVLILPIISFEAYAQQSGGFYEDLNGWKVYQYKTSESSPNPSCSVVHFMDHADAMRIERVEDGYFVGLNGLNRDQQGPQYPLKFWFDGDRSNEFSGNAAFVRDASFADDDWLSFFQKIGEAPGAVENIAKSNLLSFAFQMPGNRTGNDEVTVSFDLAGSAAALQVLEDCYLAAHDGVTSDALHAVSANSPTNDRSCPDDGPRLPGSGICQWRGVNYLNIVEGTQPALYEGCEWRLNEAVVPGGDVFLYMAAFCDGRLSKLEVSGGAHSGDLNLVVSALEGGPTTRKWATLIAVDPENPEDPACGPFGSPGDATAYWRVLDEFAIYFDLGQDAYADVDPRSVTLIRAADLPN